MLHQLMFDVLRLLGSWWRVDRVRISPVEGRLLRMEPPCCVIVESRPAEVVARTSGQAPAGPFVTYDCRSVDGSCLLRVVPRACGRLSDVFWTENGVEREINEAAVEVFSR